MYTQIEAKFFADEKINALSCNDARYLFFTILANQNRNVFGCYFIPKDVLRAYAHLSKGKFNKCFLELTEAQIIDYDDNAQVLIIRHFLRYNPIEGDNQIKGALTKVKEQPKSYLWREVANALAYSKKGNKDLISELEKLAQIDMAVGQVDLQSGQVTQTDNIKNQIGASGLSNSNSTSSNTSTQNKSNTTTAAAGGGEPCAKNENLESLGTADIVDDYKLPCPDIDTLEPTEDDIGETIEKTNFSQLAKDNNFYTQPTYDTLQNESDKVNRVFTFDDFWKVYPRQVGKRDAKKAWNKISPNQELIMKILMKITQARKSYEWTKENGQYIPHPKTWLDRGGWDDEYIQDIPQKTEVATCKGYKQRKYSQADYKNIAVPLDDVYENTDYQDYMPMPVPDDIPCAT